MSEVKIDYNPECTRRTFETRFATRATISMEIDGELFDVVIGLEMKCNETDDCIRFDLWIDELGDAPEFELTEELSDELEKYILSLDEGGSFMWKGEN